MTTGPGGSLHHEADAALSRLVARYRVVVDEDPVRGLVLDRPPDPGTARVVCLVPDGTDGESLTVVVTAVGGLSAHVRRSSALELAAGAPDLEQRLLALAAGLGWTRRG